MGGSCIACSLYPFLVGALRHCRPSLSTDIISCFHAPYSRNHPDVDACHFLTPAFMFQGRNFVLGGFWVRGGMNGNFF